MKRTPDTRGKLPSFLDETTAEADTDATQTTTADGEGADAETVSAGDDGATEAVATTESAAAEGADGSDDAAVHGGADTADAATDGETTAADARTPRTRRQAPPQARTRGTATIVLGATVLLAGIVMTLISGVGDAAAIRGVDPNGMLVLGTVLLAAGSTWRHVARLQSRLDQAEVQRRENAESLQNNLQILVAAHHADLDKPPAEGEELRHVLMSLQRQDEKINNLTKAIKMYGKPLMEITGQGTELAGTVASVKALVEGGAEAARQGLARMEAQLKAQAGGKQEAEEQALQQRKEQHKEQAEMQAALHATVQKVEKRVEQLANAKAPSFEPMQQQVGRLEVTLAAVAQRLEDSEVRKSLLRLEEATQKGRETLQEILRGDLVKQSAVGLQEKLEKATKTLKDAIAQLQENHLGSLESTVREIQREVTGVATATSQINAAMKSGARAAVAAAPAAAPAAAAPAAKESRATNDSAGAKPAAAAAAPAAAPAAEAEPGTGGGYKTGARSTGSKNVLGAIAKLKQMKS